MSDNRRPHPFATVFSEAELIAWGNRAGREVQPPAVFALRGDLGAGKSTLARAIIRGAGVNAAVPSPTFNLVFRYDSPRGFPIQHLDLYRLERAEEVWDLGWDNLGASGDLVLIEWPQRAEALLPAPRWEITLEEDETGGCRYLRAEPVGEPPALPLPGNGGGR